MSIESGNSMSRPEPSDNVLNSDFGSRGSSEFYRQGRMGTAESEGSSARGFGVVVRWLVVAGLPSISGKAPGPSTQSAEAPRLDNSKSSQEASAPATAVSVTPMGQRAVQANAPSAGAAMAPTSPQPANSAPARVATAPSEPAQTVRGVTDTE